MTATRKTSKPDDTDALDAELTAMLGSPERVVRLRPGAQIPEGLLQDINAEELEAAVEGMISTQAAGAALHQARQQRELTLRQAGEASGRSAPRIKAIEDTGTDIHLGTVVAHARALGYAVRLSLLPLDGQGPVIEADLSGDRAG